MFSGEYRQLGKHVVSGAGFISNFVLWHESGYFDTAAETKPLLHLWSLAIEEQFYIIWPPLLYAAWKWRFNLLPVILVVLVGSFCLNVIMVRDQPVGTFYAPITRFWELLIGSVLAYSTLHKLDLFAGIKQRIGAIFRSNIYGGLPANDGTRLISEAKAVAGLALVVVAVFALNKQSMFPGFWALLPVVGAYLLISAGPEAWLNRRVLSNRVMVWLGLISYPLYLWHWPLLAFARIVEYRPSPMVRVAAIFISVVFAWMTYRVIEHPVRFGRHGKTITIMLIAVMVGTGLAGSIIYARDGFPLRDHTELTKLDVTPTSLQDPHQLPEAENCLSFFKNSPVTIDKCASNTSRPEVLILGDSHAGQWYKGLIDSGIPVAVIWNGSCPPIGLNMSNSCEARWKEINKFTLAHRDTVKLVILAGYYSQYMNKTALSGVQNDTYKIVDDEIKASGKTTGHFDFIRGEFDKSIAAFESMGIRVGLMLDVPELPYKPSSCLKRNYAFSKNNRSDCSPVPRAIADQRQLEARQMASDLIGSHPNLKLFDPVPYLCDMDFCHSIINRKLVYWDDNHLNDEGSKLIAKPLSEWIDREFGIAASIRPVN